MKANKKMKVTIGMILRSNLRRIDASIAEVSSELALSSHISEGVIVSDSFSDMLEGNVDNVR